MSYLLYVTRDASSGGFTTKRSVSVSGTDTYYSEVFGGIDSDGQSVTLAWTGTPTGAFTLWTTDNPNANFANDDDWVQDTGFTVSPAGSAGKAADQVGNQKSLHKRIKYVNACGTGEIKGSVTVERQR